MIENTIEEAVEKWCPFARVGVIGGANAVVAVNRHPSSEVMRDVNCIGVACMAWQWTGARAQGGGNITLEHSELVTAGLDPSLLLAGREIALPVMEGKHQGLSLKTAKVRNVWRDAETKVAYVLLAVIGQGAEEKVGGCGLCSKSLVE